MNTAENTLSKCAACLRRPRPQAKTPGLESLTELYRIGHGPSSSHTMGPYRASEIFLKRTPSAARYEATLYGSLSATGRGHFTDKAITDVLGASRTTIVWSDEVKPFHPNGLELRAYDANDALLDSWLVYSIGGGALAEEGKVSPVRKIYPLDTMEKVLGECARSGRHFWEIFDEVEGAEGWAYLAKVRETMFACVETGLKHSGVLPGGLNLPRKAQSIYRQSQHLSADMRRTAHLAAYAYAASEENAALGLVVTAPTCGSCGTVPSVLRYLRETYDFSDQDLDRALAVAGMVGNLAKQNGSISGAEAGCQAEVGVAASMAAAAAAFLMGGSPSQCEYAAEMSLEHFLGLTCDPVKGLVQVPCIERNAIAANRALIAAELALLASGRRIVSFDSVIQTMLQTGHDLPAIYRETSQGGLAALCSGGC